MVFLKEGKVWKQNTIGQEHELDMLGKFDASKLIYEKRGEDPRRKEEFDEALKKLILYFPEKVKIMKRGHEVERDLRIQPESRVFQDIYNDVAAELLGFDNSEEEDILKKRLWFFNTLNSPLDKQYGTDSVFIWVDEKGKKHFCTIDVTLNSAKEEGYLADVIIMGEPPEDKEEYEDWVSRRAAEIASKLRISNTLQV